MLWYDFTVDNPRNPDVRGVPLRARPRALSRGAAASAGASRWRRRSRARVCRVHPALYTLFNALPLLRTHVLCWIAQAADAMSDAQPFLPFALPEIGDEEIAEVVDTLRSGWVTTGPKAQALRGRLRAFLGDPALQSHRRQLGHRRPAPGARGARHRPGRRGHHHHPHLHRHRRGGALPRRRRDARRHRPGHAVHRPARGRGGDHAAHARRSSRCTTAAWPPTCRRSCDIAAAPRPEGGRGRRARAARPPAAAGWSARSAQRRHGVQLLRQQDHHHRRGRHARDARRGARQAHAR